ncbi:MAG: protease HtpX [Oligoflexales bacterium]
MIMRRIFLFILTNFLVLVTISLVINLLGIQPYLTAQGINYESLMLFCAIWGMGGAFISLLLSKTMAKWMTRARVIDPNRASSAEQTVYQMVDRLAKSAGLSKTPEVAIYDSAEVNAFATGPSKNNALVAVSAGLLNRMNKDELEGVLGHEIAHVANGDMVTMTLIQGVINAFVMFFARIVAFALSNAMRRGDDEGPSYFMQHMLVLVFDILFGILGSIVVCYFSRLREYRADVGGAQFAGRHKMIAALQALMPVKNMVSDEHQALATLKISGSPKGLMALLMSHPPLEKRIEKLKMYA